MRSLLLIILMTLPASAAEPADSPFVTSARDSEGQLIRWERDRNEDGKIDERMTRDETGRTELKGDRDFDGKFEELTVREYLRDNLLFETVEAGDRKVERTYLYDQNMLVETTYEKGKPTGVTHSAIRAITGP